MKHIFNTDHFLVAYVDVLGQSNKILEHSTYPPSEKALNQIKQNLSETSEYVIFLRDAFRKHFKKSRKLKDILESLPKKQKKIEQRMRTFSAELLGVSDSLIISVPLENKTDNCVPINNILATFKGICLIYNIALASHKPIRGGIDVGWGTRLSQNEVYGSALVKAYKLETKEAGYPRIIIGESLWKYINYVESLKPSTEYGVRAENLARQSKSFVVKDQDGKYILDVIGRAANSYIESINPELVRKGYHYIMEFKFSCDQKDDKKLASRYKHLEDYFESKLSLWGTKRYDKSQLS
jgi:hypothetical protein